MHYCRREHPGREQTSFRRRFGAWRPLPRLRRSWFPQQFHLELERCPKAHPRGCYCLHALLVDPVIVSISELVSDPAELGVSMSLT